MTTPMICWNRYLSAAKQTPKLVTVIQNAAIYYQCLVTKRQAGTMAGAARDNHAKKNYKGFTVPAFLCWWKTVCHKTPPSWLTQDLMGMSTGNDAGKRHAHKRPLVCMYCC